MKSIKILIVFTFLFSLISCQDDNNIPVNESDNQVESSSFLENFGDSTQARFIGTVVNEQNNPITGVTIQIGSTFAITDSNGIFSINQATVYEKFAYVKASKDGFIDGSRALVPTSGINQVKIMLLDMEPTAVITSGQEMTVDLPDGTEVAFSGDFETELGAAYQGDISVTVKHLSPDDGTMSLQMPGSLLAENMDGDLRILETLGMIAVELRGDNGEELNIASGTTATIRIPVASAISNPPTSVPLWSFNEEFGYWQEEGVGTLEGSKFVGEVTHFSFWNWDFQYPSATVCITLQDVNGNVLPYTALSLYSPALNSTGSYGYTNGNGEECGLVPQDDTLTLVVPNYGCTGNNFTTTIGPFSGDDNIIVTVSGSNALTTNLTATLNDCDGNAISNGYLQLFYSDSTSTYPINDGLLDLVLDYCDTSTTFSAQVINLDAGQSTAVVNGNFTVPTTDLGTQMSCIDLVDTDGDGVIDIDEDINGNNDLNDDDTDEDGVPNYQDEDDDGDGVNTADEDYDNDGNPMNEDSDGDQTPDYLDELDVLIYGNEIPGEGCSPNLTYDLDLIISYYSNLINNTYEFYLTEADANASVNPLSSPFVTDSSIQMFFIKATNTVTGVSATAQVYVFEEYLDSDQDGLTDCEEITGIDNGFGNCNPNGNITDPFDADSDDDGFNDCIEALEGTDPNDVTDFPVTPVFNCCDNDTLSGMDVNTIVNANDDVQLFEVITPNGDGYNDGFFITNIDLYTNNTFSVFNEQDDLVYQTTAYNTTNNYFLGVNSFTNIALTDGTYRYQLIFTATDGQENNRNGFVCIVTQGYPNVFFSSCNIGSGFDPILP